MKTRPFFLTRSALVTGLRAVIVIAVIAVVLEGATRIEAVWEVLPPPSTGSTHPEFDKKLNKLNELLDSGVTPNCLIIGDSTGSRNLNPEVLSETYEAETGEPLVCYNFALGGQSMRELYVLTELALDYYQPDVILYGATAGQYGRQLPLLVANSPWAQYRLGEFSVRGYLTNKSTAFAAYLGIIRAYLGDPEADHEEGSHVLSRYGQDASTIRLGDNFEAARAIIARSDEVATLQPDQVTALENLLSLTQEKGIELWVVEMPFHEINFSVSETAEEQSIAFRVLLQSHVEDEPNTLFLSLENTPDPLPNFTNDEWKDTTHLNTWGADIYSAWLAKELAKVKSES